MATAPSGCSCVLLPAAVFDFSLLEGHLDSLEGGWLGLLLGACLAGELAVEGAPGECDAWRFFSSEKSCLITSKKLLNGLPTQTGRKEKNTERKQTTHEQWG